MPIVRASRNRHPGGFTPVTARCIRQPFPGWCLTMLSFAADKVDLAILLLGAVAAGFVSGFAGFGTALVSAGFWFHALPAAIVPPLVVIAAIGGQLVGLVTVREAFDWNRATPFLIGGAAGVPFGVWALSVASPDAVRLMVGLFLTAYALYQLVVGLGRLSIGGWGGKPADGVVGISGGILGGFAGLSGALPLVWLQLKGGSSDAQRAVYQPFNLIVLCLAAIGMAIGGQITQPVLMAAAWCLPVTLAAAWIGARLYTGVSQNTFRRIVLILLLVSGTVLLAQSVV